MVHGKVSEYIPNPTFEVVARPGAQEEYYRNGNPEGKSDREIFGEPMRAIPAFREPAPRLELMDEQGVDRTLMFPTLASLVEERMRDDPELMHVVDPRAQRVDVRDLAVQLRGPHLRHAGHHAADRREGDRGARVGRRARRPGRPGPARRRCPGYRGTAVVRAARSSTRSGRRSSSTTSSSPCTPRTAATTRYTERLDSAAAARCCPSSRRLPDAGLSGVRSRTRSRR